MTVVEPLEVKFKESIKWLGLDGLTNEGNDKALKLLYLTLNEKLKEVKTFDELETFLKHTATIGQSRPFIKDTRHIVSQFESVSHPEGHVRYDYGYGKGLEEWPISKLHERIEYRSR